MTQALEPFYDYYGIERPACQSLDWVVLDRFIKAQMPIPSMRLGYYMRPEALEAIKILLSRSIQLETIASVHLGGQITKQALAQLAGRHGLSLPRTIPAATPR